MITNLDVEADGTDTRAEPCFRLMYRSRSLLTEGSETVEEGLTDILRVARVNNRDRGWCLFRPLSIRKQRYQPKAKHDSK